MLGERVVCPSCRQTLGVPSAAGAELRFLRALGFGVLAAAIGGALWYAIRAASGYELGLVAVGVGILVGIAVRTGAHGRGGIGYQVMALLLTYLTVCGTWLPLILDQVHTVHGPGGFLVAFFAVGAALTIPFRLDAMGILIVAFALWEAWKINQAPPAPRFTGPFQLGQSPPATEDQVPT